MQPDTIIPNLYNPQSLNRFSYVQNNPIRFKDPSGHKLVEDYGNGTCSTSGFCSGSSTYNPPPAGEDPGGYLGGGYPEIVDPDNMPSNNNGLSCPRNHPTCGFGPGECGLDGLVNCPAEIYDGTDMLQHLPRNTTLHYFDTNNVNVKIPIYDFSTSPPTVIGYRRISYVYDLNAYHFDILGVFSSSSGAPDNPTGLAGPAYTVVNKTYVTVANTTKQVTSLLFKTFGDDIAITPLCPICQPVFTTSSVVSTANKMIAFDALLQIYDIYDTAYYHQLPHHFDLPLPKYP